MIRRKPIWTAARLNAAVVQTGDASFAFTPWGEIVPLDRITRHSTAAQRGGLPRSDNDEKTVADIAGLNVAGIETVTTNLRLTSPLLACCALDPESWCIGIINSDALQAVGPFRDVSAPIREWLIRAANLGHCLGMLRIMLSLPSGPDAIRRFVRRSTEPLPLNTNEDSITPVFPLPELVPTADAADSAWLAAQLEVLDENRLGRDVRSREDIIALSAGVWQMNGFLDRSHALAQSVEGRGKHRAGDYWHASMHRSEPDYSNAKYWFRRVGVQGIHRFLASDADQILSICGSPEASGWRTAIVGQGPPKWNALSFVDLCEHLANHRNPELLLAARKIQLIEMALLLSSTYHDAFG